MAADPPRPQQPPCEGPPPPTDWAPGTPEQEAQFTAQRETMVRRQLAARDIHSAGVLQALGAVPRHRFVRSDLRHLAYADRALPYAFGQTVSQPYIVALMTQAARPRSDARVLDIGTGSGYQAAVLAELVDRVHSLEILRPLADNARDRLRALGYDRVAVRCADGWAGLEEEAPFDLILVAAAPEEVPPPLLEQLAPGGRLVLPVGRLSQDLVVLEKDATGRIDRRLIAAVHFVPMTR